MTDAEATVLAAVVMIVGLAGTVIPFLPGLALIWATALVYGLLVGFGAVGISVMVLLTVIVAAGIVKSILVPRRMAEGHGVSGWSQVLALVGAVLGIVFIPFVGVLVGALVGLFVAELVNQRNWSAAARATVVVAKSFGVSTLIDVALAMLMIGLWSIWAFVTLS